MFVRVNAIFNTWGVILHEGRIGGFIQLHFVNVTQRGIASQDNIYQAGECFRHVS